MTDLCSGQNPQAAGMILDRGDNTYDINVFPAPAKKQHIKTPSPRELSVSVTHGFLDSKVLQMDRSTTV
jgi:hypothetical protein